LLANYGLELMAALLFSFCLHEQFSMIKFSLRHARQVSDQGGQVPADPGEVRRGEWG